MSKVFSVGNKEFQHIIKEIFITKILSAVKVGPKFYSLCGFDIIWYSDGVEFILERCSTEYNLKEVDQELHRKSLKTNMKIMHFLHICHCDLKYDNMGWSQEQ